MMRVPRNQTMSSEVMLSQHVLLSASYLSCQVPFRVTSQILVTPNPSRSH